MTDKTIKIIVDTLGRPCDGCVRCCEGWLTTKIFETALGPMEGGCKYLGIKGCNIYEQRPTDPCKVFQCVWKENSSIPEFMKPNKSNIIMLLRYIEPFYYYRMVRTGEVDPKVFEWAKEYSLTGKNLIAYDLNNRLMIYSQSAEFRNLARKQLQILSL